MTDFIVGFVAGCGAALLIASVWLLFRAWQRGNSRDTLPDGVEPIGEPDLTRAIVEHAVLESATRVLQHAVPMAQLAAGMDQAARWRMVSGDGRGSIELPIRDAFFLDVERLDIAVRAYEGAKLSEHDQAVLVGIVEPNRFGANSMPTLLLNDAS